MAGLLRRWWPTLALLALGLASAALLRSAQARGHEVLQRTITSLDNVSESRSRLLRSYLIHAGQGAGDRTFGQASALAELRAAEYALQNWVAGRSGIADFQASPPADETLVAPLRDYEAALRRLREGLVRSPEDDVELRRRFSEAEHAGAVLERAIHATVRGAVDEQQRANHLRLGGWSVLLLTSIMGATYARRALGVAEERREATEARLSRLREVAPVGIAECDREGRLLAANRAWCHFTGRPEREWTGRAWWEALDEDDRGRARALWEADREAGETTVEARLARREAGTSPAWVLIHAAERNPGATPAQRRVVTLTDISQQRRAEEQLQHAQRMEAIGRLAGGVAHDFNNLLTSIRGFASLALADAADDALRSDLEEIERAADRGKALTRQLLTFSRQDRVDPQVIEARRVVGDLKRLLERLVPGDVRIEMALDPSPAPVLADPSQLEQVVTNLVINASDAMEGRGRIRIAVGTTHVEEAFDGERTMVPAGDYVLLSVSDTGPGIPPEVRERIFEPFFTTKPRGKGTGLGLSTVWGIVRQSGGHVHVYSERGQGTVFKVYLPAAAGLALPRAAPGAGAPPTPETPGMALVVEDEDAVRRLTCRVLELRGWRTLEAADGTEALRLAEEHGEDIDLLITDLMMRGVGGIELAERLRAGGIEVPTLFISGYADAHVDLGGAEFLEKPFSPAALVERVAAVLAKGSA